MKKKSKLMKGIFEKNNSQACVLAISEIIIEADASEVTVILKC